MEEMVTDCLVLAGDAPDTGNVPAVIRLIPKGQVRSEKGDFIVDEESFRLISGRFAQKGIDLVIDYEHQTLHDIQAPAAGWISELKDGGDAILAVVRWTDRAKEYLRNREYRYLSPVVLIRKNDRKAVGLHSVALTNTPAINGQAALVNKQQPGMLKEDAKMELQKLIRLLGLGEDATEADVEAALKALLSREKQQEVPLEAAANKEGAVDATIAALLELKADATVPEVAAAIQRLQAGGGTLAAEVKALKDDLAKRDAQGAVEAALKEGKISAAQKDWAFAYALKDLEGFRQFAMLAARAVPVGGALAAGKKTAAAEPPADVDMAVLKSMGISGEDYRKYYKKEEE